MHCSFEVCDLSFGIFVMRKHIFGRQLKRDTNERKALFKGLMTSLIMHESITTTEEKAKSIKGQVEKLVTKAKKRDNQSRSFLQPFLSADAVEKVISNLAPRFADRPGGYTRLIKVGKRFSDNASMAIIEWVDKPVMVDIISPEGSKSTKENKKASGIQEVVNIEATTKVAKQQSDRDTKKEKKETKSKSGKEEKRKDKTSKKK